MAVFKPLLLLPLPLLLLFLQGILTADLPGYFVREGDSQKLPCEAEIQGELVERRWLKTFIDGNSQTDRSQSTRSTLFTQVRRGDVQREAAAGQDMFVDGRDFSLSLDKTSLGDDSVYTCLINSTQGGTTYSYCNVTIYVLPELLMSVDEETVTAGDNVTVNCSVARVTPELLQTDFEMMWGHRLTSSVGMQNQDGTYQYRLSETRSVTEDDNNATVTCLVTPRIGSDVTASRVLSVTSSLFPVEGGASLSVDQTDVKLGDRVVFTCGMSQAVSIDITMAVTTFYHEDIVIQKNRLLTYHTNPMDPSSHGRYSCHITDGEKYIAKSNTVTLTVSAHKEHVVEAGSSTTLTCDVTSGGEIYDFSWLRGYSHYHREADRTMFYWSIDAGWGQPRARSDISLDESTYSLTIGQVQEEDNTVFTCYYLNDMGDQFLYTRVIVRVEPTLSMSISRDVVVENEEVVVTCSVPRVNPALLDQAFYMTWRNRFHYPARSGINSQGTYSYEIRRSQRAQREDAGNIRCEVHQDEIILQESVQLTVRYPPEGEPTVVVNRRTAIPGDLLHLTCNIDNVIPGDPPDLRARWYRDDLLLGQGFGDALRVTLTAEESLTGQYSCAVGNSAGFTAKSAIVDIHVQPRVVQVAPSGTPTVILDQPSITEGQTVALTCDDQDVNPGNPPDLMVRWFRDDQPLTTGQFSDQFKVTIKATPGDGGRYSCQVGNTKAFTPRSPQVSLTVQTKVGPRGRPEVELRPQRVLVGEEVTVTCHVRDVVPGVPRNLDVTWYKDGSEITDSTDSTVRSDILVRSFTAQLDDAGSYSCSVSNEIGQTEQSPIKTLTVSRRTTTERPGSDEFSESLTTAWPSTSEDSGPSTVNVIGGGVGGAAAFILLIGLLVLIAICCSRKKNGGDQDHYENPTVMDTLPLDRAPAAPPPYINSMYTPEDLNRYGARSNTYNSNQPTRGANMAQYPQANGDYINEKAAVKLDEPEYWSISDDEKPRDLYFDGDQDTNKYVNTPRVTPYYTSK